MRRLARRFSCWLVAHNLAAPSGQGHPLVPGSPAASQHCRGGMQLFPILRIRELGGNPPPAVVVGAARLTRGMTMNTGLYRIGWGRLAVSGSHFADRPGRPAADDSG